MLFTALRSVVWRKQERRARQSKAREPTRPRHCRHKLDWQSEGWCEEKKENLIFQDKIRGSYRIMCYLAIFIDRDTAGNKVDGLSGVSGNKKKRKIHFPWLSDPPFSTSRLALSFWSGSKESCVILPSWYQPVWDTAGNKTEIALLHNSQKSVPIRLEIFSPLVLQHIVYLFTQCVYMQGRMGRFFSIEKVR